MNPQIASRAAAFGLALLMTLGMMGSIDFLATNQPAAAAMMAAAGTPRA